MSGAVQATRFRALLDRPGPITVPGCYDVLSAMLVEEAGFPAVFASGYGVAASSFGHPDIGLTSLAETSAFARNLIAAVDLPVVVDADNGYGDEDNVVRTVRELEGAGAAAMILEDQVLPKRCGHTEDKQVLPLEVYLRKLRAALAARETPLVVIARTDAAELDEAIARARAFHAEGADVTLVDGLRSIDDARRVGAEIPGHKQLNLIDGGKTPLLPDEAFAEMGFKVILYSTPALFAAVHALRGALARLAETRDLGSISAESVRFRPFQEFLEQGYRRRPYVRRALGGR